MLFIEVLWRVILCSHEWDPAVSMKNTEWGPVKIHLGTSLHSQPVSLKSSLHFPYPKIGSYSQRSKLLTGLELCMRINHSSPAPHPVLSSDSVPRAALAACPDPWLVKLGPPFFSCLAKPKAIHLSLTFWINFLDSCLPVHLAVGWPDAQYMLKAKGRI